MNTMFVALMQKDLLWAMLATALVALALRWLKPALRSELVPTWSLLALGGVGQLGAMLALPYVQAAGAAMVEGLATALVVLAMIQLTVLALFHGLMPAVGIKAPRIAQDLTVTSLSIGWVLLWMRMSGVDAAQLFTTSAIITAVLAFAMQDTLGNVLGGVALQLDNSLRVGEWVRMDDISGRVVDVRWRYTAIETRTGETVVVPNSWLMKNRFAVLRSQADPSAAWRRTVFFNVDASAAPSVVIAALEQAVADGHIAHVAASPAASAVLMDTAGGFYRYALRYWLTAPQLDDPTDSAVRLHALAALVRAGVGLGLEQEERLMIKENDNWRLAQEKRDLQRRLAAVQRTALFANLSVAEQEALAQHLVHAPFVQGSTLTRQGAVAHWLYLIVQGEASVLVETDGVSTPVSTLRDGDFFGEMGMLTGEPRSASVLAVTDVDCYRLDKVGFAQVLAARPGMADDISAVLAERRKVFDAKVQAAKHLAHAAPSDDLLARMKSFFGLSD
jgi:small-conductance mechanosensitive channel